MKRNGETVEYQVVSNIPHLREKNQQNLRESPCFLREWRSSDRFWLSQRERLFCAFLLKKLPEDTFYWTFILLYSCQNKKTQEGRGMKDVELRYVGGHVEVYTGTGAFLFSADTLREAMEELDAA